MLEFLQSKSNVNERVHDLDYANNYFDNGEGEDDDDGGDDEQTF